MSVTIKSDDDVSDNHLKLNNLHANQSAKQSSAHEKNDSDYSLPTVSYSRRKGFCGFFKHLFYTYDRVVLLLTALKYMNEGGLSMIIMTTVNIMNNH